MFYKSQVEQADRSHKMLDEAMALLVFWIDPSIRGILQHIEFLANIWTFLDFLSRRNELEWEENTQGENSQAFLFQVYCKNELFHRLADPESSFEFMETNHKSVSFKKIDCTTETECVTSPSRAQDLVLIQETNH